MTSQLFNLFSARQSHPVSLVQQTAPFPESEALSILRQKLALNHIGLRGKYFSKRLRQRVPQNVPYALSGHT